MPSSEAFPDRHSTTLLTIRNRGPRVYQLHTALVHEAMHLMQVDRDDVCLLPTHGQAPHELMMNEGYTLSLLCLSICPSFASFHNQRIKCGLVRDLKNSFSTEIPEPLCQDHKRDFVENHFLKIPAHYDASDRCYDYHLRVEREQTVFTIGGNPNSVGSGVGDGAL